MVCRGLSSDLTLGASSWVERSWNIAFILVMSYFSPLWMMQWTPRKRQKQPVVRFGNLLACVRVSQYDIASLRVPARRSRKHKAMLADYDRAAVGRSGSVVPTAR